MGEVFIKSSKNKLNRLSELEVVGSEYVINLNVVNLRGSEISCY